MWKSVQGMFAGRIEVNGQTFYVPFYPCVTDFSAIPAIEIPVDTSPQFLIPQIAAHINAGASEVEKGTRKMAMGTSWPRRERR